MNGLIACFAIFCLSLTSGAPNQENVHTFDSDLVNLESANLISAVNSIASHKDELVHAVCIYKSKKIEHECKIYVKYTEKVCDIKLNYTTLSDYNKKNVKFFNSGHSKAVFAVREDETKVKLTSINLEDCQVKMANVDVSKADQVEMFILPNENNYDVLYVNTQLCKDFMCKATYDYEGNIVKAASVFPLSKSFIGRYQFEYVNGIIFAHSVDNHLGESNGVFLVHDEDKEPQILVNVTDSYLVGFSADENKVSYCLRIDKNNTIACTQYDIEGKTKLMEFNITIGNKTIRSVYPYNLLKGMIVAIEEYNNNGALKTNPVSITHYDENGKQDKSVTIDAQCSHIWSDDMKFYKNSNGRYCYLRVCPDLERGSVDLVMFVQDTCIDKSELF